MSLKSSVCRLSAQEFRATFVCFPKPHSSLQNLSCSITNSQGLFHVYAFKSLPLALLYFTFAILGFLAQENVFSWGPVNSEGDYFLLVK